MDRTVKKGKRMKVHEKATRKVKKETEKKEEKTQIAIKKEDSKFKIFDFTVWQILQYFIIYSFIGCIIETLFGLLTKGVIESRQSILYGPFCCIYGLGAIFLLCIPQKAKKINWTLFLAGFIIGSVIEYLVSWIGECIFHVKWWDYSELAFNINGRICLIFSIFWGILTIILNKVITPSVDNFINKIPTKKLHIITVVLIIFIAFNIIITSFALKMFSTRLIYNYELQVQGMEEYYEEYLNMYKNEKGMKEFVDKVFSDKKMLKTFPNLKLTLKDGSILLVKDVLIDLKPYYFKIF